MTTIIDIETIALPEAEIRSMLPPFDPDSVKVPGNYKKPETVSAFIDDARLNYGNDIIKRAALSPRYGRIAIAGVLTNNEVFQTHTNETACIETIFRHVILSTWRIAGYGIKSFDFPFVIRRALALQIDIPTGIYDARARYRWSERIIDMADLWRELNGRENDSLSEVLAELGLPAKTGTGADFGALWATDKNSALAYNAQDLRCEYALAEMLGL